MPVSPKSVNGYRQFMKSQHQPQQVWTAPAQQDENDDVYEKVVEKEPSEEGL